MDSPAACLDLPPLELPHARLDDAIRIGRELDTPVCALPADAGLVRQARHDT